MTSSPPPPAGPELLELPSASESQLNALVYDLSNQVNATMDNMLKMITEVNQNSCEVQDEIGKCMELALEKKKMLEEGKEHYQKAAYAVLSMLNNQEMS